MRLRGSYTVEASIVMVVVFFTIASMIQYSYQLCHETVAAMALQEKLEYSRQMWEEANVKGSCQVGDWSLEIQMKAYHPENFLRKTTLLEILENEVEGVQE